MERVVFSTNGVVDRDTFMQQTGKKGEMDAAKNSKLFASKASSRGQKAIHTMGENLHCYLKGPAF